MPQMNADSGERPQLSPTAVPLAELAKLFTRLARQPVTEEMLAADVAAGAPQNADGTMNLVHYTAWLAKEVSDAT